MQKEWFVAAFQSSIQLCFNISLERIFFSGINRI
jgi:hypothetical protein